MMLTKVTPDILTRPCAVWMTLTSRFKKKGLTGESRPLKKWRATPQHWKSCELHTDNHIVKIWTLAYLLRHRIVQLESYAEIAKKKSSLDVLKTKKRESVKKALTFPTTWRALRVRFCLWAAVIVAGICGGVSSWFRFTRHINSLSKWIVDRKKLMGFLARARPKSFCAENRVL